MKKYFKPLLLFASAMGALFSFDMYGQMPQLPPIPVDSAVRIGHLDNGLTYYIRHNEYPKGQADFYIAQKVGSIQEEDSQRGLAHFLECKISTSGSLCKTPKCGNNYHFSRFFHFFMS